MLRVQNVYQKRGTRTRYIAPLVSLCALVALWALIGRITALPPFILPSPSLVAQELWHNRIVLMRAIGATLSATIIGLGIALSIALGVALAMDLIPLVRHALYPLAVVSQTIQILAVAPLIILWIGLGIRSTIAIVVLFCFFPVLISLVQGLADTPMSFMRQFAIMRASPLQTWWHARLPYALPSLFSGVRIATTYSVIAATIGEWVGGTVGLGLYILRAKNALQTAQVFGGMLITTLLSMALFGVVVIVERFSIPWRGK